MKTQNSVNNDDSSGLPSDRCVVPTEADTDAQDLFALLSPEAAAIYARVRKRDFEARRKLMESARYWEAQAEREYDQRQLEVGAQEYRGNTVSYMYDKAKCYGDMVHGCSVTLDEMGYPPDRYAKDGNVGAISRAIAAMGDELAKLRQSAP